MPTSRLIPCFYCKKEFYRDIAHINENKTHKYYCSVKCTGLDRKLQKSLKCTNTKCNKIFVRRKYTVSINNYCSRSCAASVNNVKFPKNPGTRKICVYCKKIFTSRKKFCSKLCHFKYQTISNESILKKINEFYQKNGRIPFKKEFQHALAARKRFGTWNKAIIAAGFTPNPVKFAKKHIAHDGHKCDSLAEKIIDDWLYERSISHDRRTHYLGNPTLNVDFVIGQYWIEFFGLFGEHKRYDELRKEKMELAKKYNIKLIALYPHDLFPNNNLSVIIGNIMNVEF